MTVDFGQSILASSIALGGMLVIMAIVYFIWSRIGLKKKQKYFKELHVELAPGQEIMFAGGIYGTVKSIDGDKVEVKVRSGAVLDVSRYAIQQIAQ
ncbi:preprotein translocase subunit YajC [Collinsella bouchesdurhonensis]|uniref:preprotein translocase subunit YajC n=1 Tax=Collinsella bouchesdurhonensis TaxID=1907654 RepID=UPI00096A40A6|nr:preprotein translocase subunit YajC [Collinsella bouchesdurhonensis]